MSEVEVFSAEEYPQGSDAWKAVRRGWPTASRLSAVLAGGDGKTRSKYMRQLAGERITGLDREDFKSAAMERGNIMEPELRALYAMMTGENPETVGFIRRKLKVGFLGASPDSFVGEKKVVEYKSQAPDLLIETMQAGRVPTDHIPQCQGAMLVTGREACDLMIGYTGMPPFIRTIRRDSSYCARLVVAVETFNQELEEMIAWVKKWGRE